MTSDGTGGTLLSVESAPFRWWSVGYAARLGVALVAASVLVGGAFGPANLLLNQLETSWSGGSLSYPGWMYFQAALMQIVLGVLIAGGASFGAVLLPARPRTGWAVVRRLLVGPVIAGALLLILSLLWNGAGPARVLAMAAIACVVFATAGVLAQVTRVERVSATDRVL